jgi:FixJ family two-component response regulator
VFGTFATYYRELRRPSSHNAIERITARQREVMVLVVSGMLNKQIAFARDRRNHREDPSRERDAEDADRIAGGIGQNRG